VEAKRWWIVGHDDKAWGPFEKAPLAALIAEGKSRADGLVCPEGEARWCPMRALPELADIPWPPATPPRAEPPPAASAAPAEPPPFARAPLREAPLRLNELQPVPGWPTVLLSVPTLGLWGLFSFYRTMRVYKRLGGAANSNVETLFWIFGGILAFVGLFLVPSTGFTWPLLIPAVIVGAFLLRESLRLRDLTIQNLFPRAATHPEHYPAVRSDDWHFGLWITGAVLTLTVFGAIVGVPILIAQALAWFEDWNRLSAAARARATGAAGSPAPFAVA
jgi:hypothetical protein